MVASMSAANEGCRSPADDAFRTHQMEPESGVPPSPSFVLRWLWPSQDIRLVRDKFTSLPRGFAFIHFHSIADATRALNALQGAAISGQEGPLRLCYARDRLPPPTASGAGSGASSVAADALAAATFASQYSSWVPKEYEEGKQAKHEGQEQPSGYQYDESTGYYYDATSGYYYDPNTGLFCNSTDQQWYMYNSVTGTYLPVGGGGAAGAQPQQQQGADEAEAAAAAAQTPAATVTAAPAKKKGAIIGAAPKLNAEGLLAKARQEAMLQAKKLKAEAKKLAAAQNHAAPTASAAAATAMMPPPPAPGAAATAGRPLQGVVHESKRGGPSGVIYQGKWRGGPRPQAPG
mmetsp:Transcript_20435/g.56626  ORF Transcript_20435/g.56626 Transcript_20435/m.56626 type:complete len:347 (+) Transcript_20435:1009-2049(+)